VRTTLQSLRTLVLGETLSLPIGVACALCGAALAKLALPDGAWEQNGGFVLLAFVLAALAVSLRRG
jgi:hypothetical protein